MRWSFSQSAFSALVSSVTFSLLMAVNSASMAEPPLATGNPPVTAPAVSATTAKPATPASAATSVTGKTPALDPKTGKPIPPTAQQYQQEIKKGSIRIQQLEQANQDALARNQELQLGNDNLTVQLQVLQSERSAQMFLYGAATLGMGTIIGFILCSYMLGKRHRRW